MALHRNLWSPDTCGCTIEYEWDDVLSEEQRVHSWSKTIKKCNNHDGILDKDHLNVVLPENQRKNELKSFIKENLSFIDTDVDYVWSFSGKDYKRILNIDIQGLTINQKNTIKSFCDGKFGNGKVTVT